MGVKYENITELAENLLIFWGYCINQPTASCVLLRFGRWHYCTIRLAAGLLKDFKVGRFRASTCGWMSSCNSNTGAFLFYKGSFVKEAWTHSGVSLYCCFSHQLLFCRFIFGYLRFWFPWSVVVLVISASFFTYITLLMVRQTGSKIQALQTFPRPKSNYLVPAVLKSQFAAFLSTPPQLGCWVTGMSHIALKKNCGRSGTRESVCGLVSTLPLF